MRRLNTVEMSSRIAPRPPRLVKLAEGGANRKEFGGLPPSVCLTLEPGRVSLSPVAGKAGAEGGKVIYKDIEGPEGPSIALDPEELRGWSNTEELFYKNRKIIINNVFNRPALCGP